MTGDYEKRLRLRQRMKQVAACVATPVQNSGPTTEEEAERALVLDRQRAREAGYAVNVIYPQDFKVAETARQALEIAKRLIAKWDAESCAG